MQDSRFLKNLKILVLSSPVCSPLFAPLKDESDPAKCQCSTLFHNDKVSNYCEVSFLATFTGHILLLDQSMSLQIYVVFQFSSEYMPKMIYTNFWSTTWLIWKRKLPIRWQVFFVFFTYLDGRYKKTRQKACVKYETQAMKGPCLLNNQWLGEINTYSENEKYTVGAICIWPPCQLWELATCREGEPNIILHVYLFDK